MLALSTSAFALNAAPFVQRPVMMRASVRMEDAVEEAPPPAPPPPPPPAPPPAMVMSEALPFAERPASLDVMALAGDVGFDPMGFSDYKLGPFDTPEKHMGWMREAEIKHGRICMLGTVGWISTDLGLRAPGVPAELKTASSFAAHDIAVSDGRLLMLLILCGVFEIAGSAAIQATLEGKREPGEFALVGFMSKSCADPVKLAALKQAEIKHCRLAMMAFGGLCTQGAVFNGPAFPYF